MPHFCRTVSAAFARLVPKFKINSAAEILSGFGPDGNESIHAPAAFLAPERNQKASAPARAPEAVPPIVYGVAFAWGPPRGSERLRCSRWEGLAVDSRSRKCASPPLMGYKPLPSSGTASVRE